MPCPQPSLAALRAQPCLGSGHRAHQHSSSPAHKGQRIFFTLNSDFEMYLPLSQTKVFLSDNVQKIFISSSFMLFHDSLIILLAAKFLQYVGIDMLVDMFHIALTCFILH